MFNWCFTWWWASRYFSLENFWSHSEQPKGKSLGRSGINPIYSWALVFSSLSDSFVNAGVFGSTWLLIISSKAILSFWVLLSADGRCICWRSCGPVRLTSCSIDWLSWYSSIISGFSFLDDSTSEPCWSASCHPNSVQRTVMIWTRSALLPAQAFLSQGQSNKLPTCA